MFLSLSVSSLPVYKDEEEGVINPSREVLSGA